MLLRRLLRLMVVGYLITAWTFTWADGDAPKETPSSARMIPIHLGQVDAVTGGMTLRFPVGPRLPGRIPLGFTFAFDSQDSVMSQVGGSLKPVIWPGGSGSPQVTTVVVDGISWIFQKKAALTTGSMPTADQVHQWMLQRSVDDGQAEAMAVNDPTAGITPSFNVIEILPSADGTRFFVRTSWTVGGWKWSNLLKDSVPAPKSAAGRSVILSGADAIWTGTYMGTGSGSVGGTHFTNKWGDHVSAAEFGGKLGSPTSIVITNEKSTTEWIRWDRNDAAQTITISSSPTIPLPGVVLSGAIRDLERMQNYWTTYPTPYDPNATYNNTGIFDGGITPSSIVASAGNESRTTQFTWNCQPAYVVTNPFNSSTQITVPVAYSVSSIVHPSGLRESFAYAKVGRLSTDSFNPPRGGTPGAGNGSTWTGYSAWSDYEWPYVRTDHRYDPVNPAGAVQGVWCITTTELGNGLASPLVPMAPVGGGDGGGGGGGGSTSATQGHTIVIARKQPSAHSQGGVLDSLYLSGFVWDQVDHTTTILKYPTASVPQVGDAYRGVRLIHPSATGPCAYWGNAEDPIETQKAAYLFATSAVIKEEVIHGNLVTFDTTHPDDWEPVGPIVDSTAAYDEWDLTCWANPSGSLANGLPINPKSLRSTLYSPTLPGGTTFLSVPDAFGPTQREQYHSVAGAAPAISGTSSATWGGSAGALAPTYGSQIEATPLKHLDVVTRHWDSNLMALLNDSSQKSLSGDPLTSLRPGSGINIDFGTTRHTYDSQGRVTSVTGTRGAFVATEVRSYVNGQPLVSDTTKTLTSGSVAVPLSGQIGKSFTYDTTPYRWLLTETDKLDGRPTTILQRDSMGRILKVQSSEGIVTSYCYDGWGRIRTTTREAKGAVGPMTTTYSFDPNGAWSEETTSYTDADGQAISLKVHTDYDAAGRPVKVTNSDGSYQITQYDGWGQKVLQSPILKPGQTPYGNYQWSYDIKGRVTTSYDPKGRRLTYQPSEPAWVGSDPSNGRVVSTILGPGPNATQAGDSDVSRTVKTDILGQQREVIDQKGQLSTYTYNQDGKLAATNQDGQVRAYAYNDMGWLTSRYEPEEGLTTFDSFTIGGLPLLTTQKGLSQASNLKIQVALNAWGLPSEVQVWNGTSLSTDRVLTYDTATHWLMNTWESQPNGTLMESYGYDDIGRVTAKTVSDGGGQSFTVSRTLDPSGNVSNLSYPSGGGRAVQLVKYNYDTLARPKVASLDLAYRGGMTYDQVSGTSVSQVLSLGNGATSLTKVDAGELVEVKHSFVGDVQDNFLKWSTGGLLLGRGPDNTFAYPGKSDYFHYDDLQRLDVSTIRSWDDPDSTKWDTLTQTFGYDRWGNRSSEGFTWSSPKGRTKPDEVLAWTATYNATNQLPATIKTTASLPTGKNYDDLGRLTSVYAIPGSTGSQFSWIYDASGRVVAENGATFLLDGQGLRFRRNQTDGSIQYTVYGFNQEPLSVFMKPVSGGTTSSGGAVAMMLPVDGGGDPPPPPPPPPPAGAFITQPSGPATVGVGQSMAFIGSSTYGTVFSWNFGDGGGSSASSTSHSFASPGTFTVVLTTSATGYSTSYASVAITVLPPPTVTAFTVSPSTITLGGSATFSWSTSNAISLTLDHGLGSVTGLTSKTVAPGQSGNLTYTLTATNTGGSTTATVPLYVSPSPAPVVNSFTANPTAVPAGQPVTLKWNVTQAQTISISGIGAVSGKSCTVSPTVTTTYTLSATNGSGTVTAAVTVPVIGVPSINRLSAGPSGITTGQSTMLSWDVTGAAALTLSGGGNSWTVTGDSYRIVQPSATTTYTLTASNSAGGVTRQTSVTVSAPAALAWVRSMVYGFGQLLSEERADVGTMYVQSDQVGSPSLLTDTGGHLVGRTKGLPFGERAWSSGTQSARRFTNHEDQPGSPVYMQARMYLPAYGRFAQPDPAYDQTKLDPESWNLYGYVTNNPVTHTDPDGRKAYGIKEEGEAHILSHLIGNWGDVGFLGVSGPARMFLGGGGPETMNFIAFGPTLIVDGSDGFELLSIPGGSYFAGYGGSASAESKWPSVTISHYEKGDWSDNLSSVTAEKRYVNGQMNDLNEAKLISKTEMAGMGVSVFDLIHIPTLGLLRDLWRSFRDKVGFTTQTARELAAIIQAAPPGEWFGHSYGGVAIAEAVRTLNNGGVRLDGNSVTFLAGANNPLVTNAIMGTAHVKVNGYYGSKLDMVPNIIGLQSLNPFVWAADILWSWTLMTRWSPHTYPPVPAR